jgi:hypothetical protein
MTLTQLKELAEKAKDHKIYHHETPKVCINNSEFIRKANPAIVLDLITRVEKLSEAMKNTVARADDYADSYLSQPVREALAQYGADKEL